MFSWIIHSYSAEFFSAVGAEESGHEVSCKDYFLDFFPFL